SVLANERQARRLGVAWFFIDNIQSPKVSPNRRRGKENLFTVWQPCGMVRIQRRRQALWLAHGCEAFCQRKPVKLTSEGAARIPAEHQPTAIGRDRWVGVARRQGLRIGQL